MKRSILVIISAVALVTLAVWWATSEQAKSTQNTAMFQGSPSEQLSISASTMPNSEQTAGSGLTCQVPRNGNLNQHKTLQGGGMNKGNTLCCGDCQSITQSGPHKFLMDTQCIPNQGQMKGA